MSADIFPTTTDARVYDVRTRAPGPDGSLPLTADMLAERPSGDLFGLSQNVGMGWLPAHAAANPFLILSTQGGVRAPDGTPVALGYHTGHWEIGLLVEEAAREFSRLHKLPFAAFCSDPCDGRSQGTAGMFDSLPFRNDAAVVFRRLIRSLPTRKGVLGIATCDKGLPAMMMALAGAHDLPTVLVPGGVTLPPTSGEDAGQVQTIGARFSHGLITLQEAADLGCRACATPGGGCQFLGTAATSQVVAEALGLTVPHAALAPSGQPVWLDLATRSARALVDLSAHNLTTRAILTPAAIENAMVIHAAFGGSTNLLLHIPAIAHAAGLPRPTVADWIRVNRRVPRLVDVLPNGPRQHPTVRVFLAGGVPEVMLHLRDLGVLDTNVITVTGERLDSVLDAWRSSERRQRFRQALMDHDGVDPDDVIMWPARAAERGLTRTLAFPRGNLAPEGSVIKSTAIDPSVVDADGVYRHEGPARVFVREGDAIAAIRARRIVAGDVIVLTGCGPLGTGMEETYQLTSALKHLPSGKRVALLTDARFSGVSTGACVGHVGPEGLAGGPIGRVREGDRIQIVVDRTRLEGSIDLVGSADEALTPAEASDLLAARSPHPDMAPAAHLPADTRLWAALQQASGGTWGGAVYDTDAIVAAIQARYRRTTGGSVDMFVTYRRAVSVGSAFTVVVLIVASARVQGQWPDFRGPGGQGHAEGTGMPLEWSETLNVQWKTAVPGLGWSSPVVANGRVWMTSAVAGPRGGASLRVLAFDANSGKEVVNAEVFRTSLDRAPNVKNSLASPTPVLADGHVYVHFGADGTAALDESGAVIWKTRLLYESQHGSGGSPIIVGDLLIINCDGFDEAYMVALDRKTGKRVWRTGRRQPFTQAYSTPLIIRAGERDQIVSIGAFRVTAHDPTNGREVWRVTYADGQSNEGFSNVSRPVAGHGLVFVSTGYGRTELLAIRTDGTGDVTKSHVAWRTGRGAPYTTSPLLVGDELYFVSDIGVASGVDARTGQVHWQVRLGGNYSASPLYADGRIYFQNEEGITTVIAPGREFRRLAQSRLGDATMASLAVAGDAFFLRSQGALYKIALAK